VTRRTAVALLRLASKVLPARRREWARDMRGELDFIKSDRVALSWAFGCVLASLQERVLAMLNSNGGISRPVLMLEWLMCFVPLTLLWAAAVTIIFSRTHASLDFFVAAAFGTLGPIALIVSLTATASKRNVEMRRIARLLVMGFAVMALLQILNATAHSSFTSQWLGLHFHTFVLVSLLPLLGALHFQHLARGKVHAESAGRLDRSMT
jgi:hypothetical protein